MIGQSNDIVIAEGKTFVLLLPSSVRVFDPAPHGISSEKYEEGEIAHSAFQIVDGGLYLIRIWIPIPAERAPAIKGVKPARGAGGWHFEGSLFSFAEFRLPYSGTIRIARGNSGFPLDVGFDALLALAGEGNGQVIEYDFESGIVVNPPFRRSRLRYRAQDPVSFLEG